VPEHLDAGLNARKQSRFQRRVVLIATSSQVSGSEVVKRASEQFGCHLNTESCRKKLTCAKVELSTDPLQCDLVESTGRRAGAALAAVNSCFPQLISAGAIRDSAAECDDGTAESGDESRSPATDAALSGIKDALDQVWLS
jgi:hypothetical protein